MKKQILLFALGLFCLSSCSQEQKSGENTKDNTEAAASNDADSEKSAAAKIDEKEPTPLVYFRKAMSQQVNVEIIENEPSQMFTVIKFNDEKAGKKNGNIVELKLLKLPNDEFLLGYHEFRTNGSTGNSPIFFRFDANDKLMGNAGTPLNELLTNEKEFSDFRSKNDQNMLQGNDCCAVYVFLPKSGDDLEVALLPGASAGKVNSRPSEYKMGGIVRLVKDKFTYIKK